MKKKQIVIRIMFIATAAVAFLYGVDKMLKYAGDVVLETTKNTVISENEEMKEIVSEQLEVLSSELNTKVDSINEENQKLREVIEDQNEQIEDLSEALKKIGVTFQ